MILDHKEDLRLDDAEADDHYDAISALARLGEGLSWIYQEVARVERRTKAEAAPNDIRIAVVGGILEGKPLGLLSCAFQWYAVSACNYAQLVGWLVTRHATGAKEYVRRVMPRLLDYRNKVAAHFALTARRGDNEADLAASVMTHVVYVHGRLCAAALTPVLTDQGHEVKVSKDISWSLTLAHERLVPRYWPEGLRKVSQALRVPPGTTTVNVTWSDVLGEG